MKFKFTLVAVLGLLCSLFSNNAQAQSPNYTTELLKEFTKLQADSMLEANGVPAAIFATQYGVNVYRVIYESLNNQNNVIQASGLILLPVGDTCGAPMVSWQHGTELKKDDVFSNLRGEWVIGVIAAATGYASCMPDYHGMGYGDGFHPYQHAHTEAQSVIDLLRVCKDFAPQNDVELNGQLFLMGYSQGGHATMATHKEIQELYPNEFTVTASAPMSGAYDLSGAQFDMVAAFEPYSVPGYLPYLMKGYNVAYADTLFSSYDEVFKVPYNTTIPPKLTGEYNIGAVNNVMPAVPREIIDSTYSANFFADSLHPFRIALKENDVYKWVPNTWMRISYCTSDEEVSPQNALNAYNYMIANGATKVSIAMRSETLGHFQCAQPSVLYAKIWFDSLATFCNVQTSLEEVATPGWSVLYTDGKVYGTVDNYTQPYNVYIFNAAGSLVKVFEKINDKQFNIDIANLPSTMYVVWCDAGRGLWYKFVK